MRYEILGPLRVRDGDHGAVIGARKVEMLLAILLTRGNQVITIDQLISEIWGEQAPRRAVAGIHVYVSQLRKFLERPGYSNPLVTRSPGYILRVDPGELDSDVFQELVKVGREHVREGRVASAAALFERALALWRGQVFSDLWRSPILSGFATWLTELRLESIEMMVDAQLELGRHREYVGLLYSLTAEYPLRETFYRQLMLALYRSERQADALGVFQSARRILDDELGLEPCRALQDLQRAILLGDNSLQPIAAVLSAAALSAWLANGAGRVRVVLPGIGDDRG
jgi:SARP family transcriptional regulator, regulator of embCAB operon